MAVTSIVDYLNSKGQNSSYASRKKLAEQNGIANYSGTASQNTQLLGLLQNGKSAQPAPSNNVTVGVAPGEPTKTTQSAAHSGMVPTELTDHYKNAMLETDAGRPGPYQSAYEDQISSILDTIYNRKPFDINTDANYQQLYDNYAERYTTQADRAMRDTMASANAATGGYGSTYANAVGQQAYDTTMQGLNDQNMALMNLAYNMYADDRANDYNKLSAFQGQDNIEYGRYRDDVNDWQTDRQYNANQYWNSWQNDFNSYTDGRNFDYGQYQDALGTAMQMAQNGLQVPDYLTAVIDRYNVANGLGEAGGAKATLAGIAAQALANAAKSSGGRGGSGGGNKKSSSGGDTEIITLSGKKLKPTTKYVSENRQAYGASTLDPENEYRNRSTENYITNKNTDDYVYVDGLGAVSWEDLQNYVDNYEYKHSGTKVQEVVDSKGYITYKLKK